MISALSLNEPPSSTPTTSGCLLVIYSAEIPLLADVVVNELEEGRVELLKKLAEQTGESLEDQVVMGLGVLLVKVTLACAGSLLPDRRLVGIEATFLRPFDVLLSGVVVWILTDLSMKFLGQAATALHLLSVLRCLRTVALFLARNTRLPVFSHFWPPKRNLRDAIKALLTSYELEGPNGEVRSISLLRSDQADNLLDMAVSTFTFCVRILFLLATFFMFGPQGVFPFMFLLDFSLPIYCPTASLYLGFSLARAPFGPKIKERLSQVPSLARSPKTLSVMADFIGLLLIQCFFAVLDLRANSEWRSEL